MKRLLGVALAVGLLTSCSLNYSPTEITFNQNTGGGNGTMRTDAKGLTTAITPTQDASGSAATEGAMAALGGIKDAVANFIPAVTTTETTTTTTPLQPVPAATPTAPTFPDVTPPAVPAEEIAEPEGQIEEVD